eukprot:Transcript_16103.p3 GENE.Transcript_16103~~Transcript_16103.p3  ORF type:complete len:453 (-),score=102.34 Transcript_16103:1165-2523(-)
MAARPTPASLWATSAYMRSPKCCCRPTPSARSARCAPFPRPASSSALPSRALALAPSSPQVYLCGNYGDPCASPHCLAIVRYLRATHPALVVGVHSNGGGQGAPFWRELGSLLTSPCYCRFAIDGLRDTNHLYRQRVMWQPLMAHVQAFVGAGGEAQWDFLVFRHNEHQVEAARALAVSLGFSRFDAKRTRRFVHKDTGQLHPATPVEDTSGRVVRHLEPPTALGWRNDADVQELRATLERHGSFGAYLDAACISCKAQRDREIYISAERLVFPCCFLAGELYNRSGGRQLLQLLAANQLSLEDLRVTAERSLAAVLSGPLFSHLVVASWARPSVAHGKLRTCSAVCGTEHRASASSDANCEAKARCSVPQTALHVRSLPCATEGRAHEATTRWEKSGPERTAARLRSAVTLRSSRLSWLAASSCSSCRPPERLYSSPARKQHGKTRRSAEM